MPAGDDAGVYRLDDDLALVQTVDVFSPSADDPYTFGQIAAANSLSDVYAMGGRPVTALSIVGFPPRSVPDEALRQILRGGVDKMAEAGVAVVGGHSINDRKSRPVSPSPAWCIPQRIVTNAGPGRAICLILSKPLGTGILAFAAQIGRAGRRPEAAARSMARESPGRRTDDRLRRPCLHRRDRLRPCWAILPPWPRPAAWTWKSSGTTCRCCPACWNVWPRELPAARWSETANRPATAS